MQKNCYWPHLTPELRRGLNKMLLVMRLIILLLTTGFLAAHGNTAAQTVTLSGKHLTLELVFATVEKQTGYVVLANEGLLTSAKTVTLNVRKLPLLELLDLVLKDQPLKDSIADKTIFISKKEITLPQKEIPERLLLASAAVTGVVNGPDGQTLSGVNVIVKGTKRGTTTDGKGRFSIEAKEGDVLVFSIVGYSERMVVVGGSNDIGVVSMMLSQSKLDEVQIIAYGTTTRRLSTGNVVTVGSADIEKQPVSNPLLALQGRVPGMVITQTNGMPGSLPRIEIRGRNSLNNAGNSAFSMPEPLYIVDGIPIDPVVEGGPGSLGNGGAASAFSFINTADIESISVLKDADQTSIYGSRGANGVILITTKKGKIGKPVFNINASSGYGTMGRRMKLMNRRQYLDMRYEALRNDGETGIPELPRNMDLLQYDTTRDVDWQKELMGGVAKRLSLQASYSGGTQAVQYLIGAGYQNEGAVTPGNFSNSKGSLHIGLSGSSADRKFYVDFKNSILLDLNMLPSEDYTAEAISLAPVFPALFKEDGSLNFTQGYNPLWKTKAPFEFRNISMHFKLNTGYRFSELAEIRITGGYNNIIGHSYYAVPFAAIDPLSWATNNRLVEFRNTTSQSWVVEPQLISRFSAGPVRFEAIAGGTIQQSQKERENVGARGALSDDLIKNLGAHPFSSASNSSNEYKYAALFGRLNANYLNRYIINAVVRRDGSSRFGPGNRFGNFGSIGGAWIFSEESFLRDVRILSFGKLRGSYGSSGGDGIGDYRYMELYSLTPYNFMGVRALQTDGIYNQDYAWEITRKLELGLETGWFDNRMQVSVSYYRNRSSNQLISFPYPVYAGMGFALVNLPALIQNQGIEVMLTTVNIRKKDFEWTTNFNISSNNNKLLAFPNLENTAFNRSPIGKPLGIRWVYRYAGVDPATGEYEFYTKDGAKTKTPAEPNDQTRAIDFNPEFYGGISNSFQYKGLSIDFLFQFSKQLGANYLAYASPPPGGMYGQNQPLYALNRWQKPGDQALLQRYNQNFVLMDAHRKAMLESDLGFSDASFIRLKNVSLSYTFPKSMMEKWKISNLRLYVLAQNLLTITNYKGLDPETASATMLPPLRVITAGLQVTL